MPPEPRGSRAEHSPHIWRYDLPEGLHAEVVTTTRDQGGPARDTLVIEVRNAPLKPLFDFEHWNTFKNR